MNLTQIRNIAKDLGVKPGKMKKADLVRAIQLHEGSFDCFASASTGECDQQDCSWREDCFSEASKGSPAVL